MATLALPSDQHVVKVGDARERHRRPREGVCQPWTGRAWLLTPRRGQMAAM